MNVLSNALLATLKSVLSQYSSSRVEDYCLCRKLSYALVDGRMGFAFLPECEGLTEVVEPKAYVRKVFSLAWKGEAETSLALATMSALTHKWIDEGGEVDFDSTSLIDVVDIKKGDKVIMIGYMRRVLDEIVERGARVILYEDNYRLRCEAKQLGVEAYPGSYVLLEDSAEVVIATGASLLDPRGPYVLDKVSAKEKVLLGPTATVHPYFAKLLGATRVGGSYVPKESQEKVLSAIKAGYGYHKLVKLGLIKRWFAKAS
ncbi:Rossmann-like domain-containing protein [Ignicoccus hospitalis]|uniref:Putative heavy-metal chelation domain-containing protein n=1 Tax=Ignicoccus hospitalis (strain KIN4/I / DSM 18386 / JCM 14125) TaxID=453591 RepID=A8A8Y9_IGNH4|nr:DUF364 domain-containing protein [Ignicoccus hospitalis]ABU81391.1 hypothetical protein Igni_0207 [Ignicoccus hospitalis KIN4/I]HIH90301.1 hypothetical protein [Desulfurococcaceae archaeon]